MYKSTYTSFEFSLIMFPFFRIKSIWDHRFANLRFVQMEHLTNRHGDPLFPQDTKDRVYEQCRTARNILLKV